MHYHRRGESGPVRRLLKGFVIGFSLLPSVVGLLVIYHVFIATKTMNDGTELSNRIARAAYFWVAISQPEEGVPLYPWLKYDIKEFLEMEKPADDGAEEEQEVEG